MPLDRQSRLGDRYVLEERIATGGMGEVWRATDEVLRRPVAVKVLREELASDPEFQTRFRNEAQHAAAFSHPGVANVHDFGDVDGTSYLVMELVDGEPLSTLLTREQKLSVERTLDVVGQAALALQAAHDAGVVHRDVKPGNLLVRRDGVVKVTDFGIARAVDSAPVTRTGLVVGTAQYLSPEQASGQPATPASDVYALGVVAYQCLTGRPPFTGDGPVAVALAHINDQPPALGGDVPPLVADLVLAALAKRPESRPSSAGELGRTALALRTAMTGGDPLPTAPVDPPDPVQRQPGAVDSTRLLTAPPVAGQPERPVPVALQPSPRHSRGRAWFNFLAVAGALVLLVLVLARGCDDGTPARSGASPSPSARVVTVREADFVGKPYDAVRAALAGRGLRVQRATRESDATPDTVVDVTPTGTVAAGKVVTVTVATPAPKDDAGKGKGKGKGDEGKGDG